MNKKIEPYVERIQDWSDRNPEKASKIEAWADNPNNVIVNVADAILNVGLTVFFTIRDLTKSEVFDERKNAWRATNYGGV